MLLKHRREIVDIVIAHGNGDLRKVHAALLDHPLGFLDPQGGEVSDHGVTGVLLEDALQLGDADVLVGGQSFQSDFFRIMLCQVFLNLYRDLGMVMQLIDRHRTGIKVDAVFVTVDQN